MSINQLLKFYPTLKLYVAFWCDGIPHEFLFLEFEKYEGKKIKTRVRLKLAGGDN